MTCAQSNLFEVLMIVISLGLMGAFGFFLFKRIDNISRKTDTLLSVIDVVRKS